MRLALTGNPNSGKTTMFNAITGKNEKVGNWAGVTVDKKIGRVRKSLADGAELVVVDLPGAYSMSPFTSEESVTSTYIKNENPDVILNIVDATNLSRSLFFTTQILELGIPTVVALNKSDINEKKENIININTLSKILGCPVIETTSTKSEGLKEVVKAAISLKGKTQTAPYTESDVDYNDKTSVREADKNRYRFVNEVVKNVETRKVFTKERNFQDKIDTLLTNRWLGLPIFAVIMFLVFWISQTGPGVWIAEGYEFANGKIIPGLVTYLEAFQNWVGGYMEGATPFLYELLVNGVIGGVIAVVGFLPLVMVMYFLIALLEDCGYMARATVVLDPIFKRVGLTGKSVIPLIMATGCAIPGVMSARTIRDERERRATAMLAPFMPCGAKLPVIALFSGAFFKNASWVAPLMYFVGIAIVFFGALLVNKITGHKAKKSFFIIELPEYKLPSLMRATKSMCSRGWSYIVKAGTVILVCNTAVQLMQSFNWSLQVAETADTSILASIARPFAYALIPIVGYHAWQLAAAAVTGFIAKENVVGTLAVCYVGLQNLINSEELAIADGVSGTEVGAQMNGLTAVAALAYLMFNLFSPPCFAAIGAMNSEIGSKKWLFGGIALQLGTGFTIGYLVFTVGTLITDPAKLHISGAIGGAIAIALFVIIIVSLCIKAEKSKEKPAKSHAMVN